jgi:hypothetical protein
MILIKLTYKPNSITIKTEFFQNSKNVINIWISKRMDIHLFKNPINYSNLFI